MIRSVILFLFVGIIALASSCKKNDTPPVYTEIPDVPVNITINIELPTYFHLNNIGTYVYENGGYRGVLVVHSFDDKFYAFERTCTYKPDLTCSKIYVDSTSLNFRCGGFIDTGWVSCCASLYDFSGIPVNGPSQFPLKQYRIERNGSILTIRN